MTAKDLLNYFEKYYGGKYEGVFLDAMLEYLDNFSVAFLKSCANVITLRYTNTFGKLPDVAIIEKNIDEIYDSIPKPIALPEPVEDRCSPEEFEELSKLMREKIGYAKKTEAEKKEIEDRKIKIWVPQGMCLISEKANSCKGCLFEGKQCNGFIDCFVNGENYIFKLVSLNKTN